MIKDVSRKLLVSSTLVAGLSLAMAVMTSAQSTGKTLSTNFTLVNFGSAVANVTADYYKDDGSTWAVTNTNKTFTLTANGGQKIIAQYFDATMVAGKGSVALSSDQPLGAVVQILARNQVATSGAYNGFNSASTSSTFYIPLVSRNGAGGGGRVNSQIIIQNTTATSVPVSVQFNALPTLGNNFTKTGIIIAPYSSFYYDLANMATELTNTTNASGWFGSAVVNAASGQIAVVSNLFTGSDAMQTFNAFPASAPGTKFFVPLFTTVLANGLFTPVSIQNLSGGTIAAGALTLNCVRDPGLTTGPATLSLTNTAAFDQNGSYNFNPLTDTRFPAAWFGSCKVQSPGNVVAFVQMRYSAGVAGAPVNNSAAYEAINANSTDKQAFIPLVAKHLSNGFASGVTLQNLSTQTATVLLTYKSDTATPAMITKTVTIAPESSLIHNHRLSGFFVNTAGDMPDNWVGTLTAVSNQPIHGFVQLTFWTTVAGDTFQAHNAFTQP